MKTRVVSLVAVVLGCSCLAAWALTEEWRHTAGAPVVQIFGDGKGGCALVERETNDLSHVVWLNKKGDVTQVVEPISFSVIGLMINDCTPNQVLFTGAPGLPMMVQVSKKGTVTPVAVLGGYLVGSPLTLPYGINRLGDAKGFFVVNVNTNTRTHTVVRYRYK